MAASNNENDQHYNCKRLSPSKSTLKPAPFKRKATVKKPLAFRFGSRRTISVDAAKCLYELANNQQEEVTPQQQPPKSGNRVRFSPMATVYRFTKPSREEASHRWYNARDYYYFDEDRRRSIAAVQWARDHSCMLDPNYYTSLGLEKHLSARQLCARKFKLMRHTYCVLKQQYYQRCRGIYDPQGLRAASRMFTKSDMPKLIEEYEQASPYMRDPRSRRAYLSKILDEALELQL